MHAVHEAVVKAMVEYRRPVSQRRPASRPVKREDPRRPNPKPPKAA